MIIIKKRTVFNFSIIFVIIVVILLGIFLYDKLNKVESLSENRKEKEINNLIGKVSKIYLFPEGEKPTVAVVSDPQLLKDQFIFTEAQIGDRVFLFPSAGKAILYRPSINKIIEDTPINK